VAPPPPAATSAALANGSSVGSGSRPSSTTSKSYTVRRGRHREDERPEGPSTQGGAVAPGARLPLKGVRSSRGPMPSSPLGPRGGRTPKVP
jgi:hypothetical protein